jgi:hypothetical protein
MSLDAIAEEIVSRIIRNAHWASLYLSYFESSNTFLRTHHPNLNDDAREFLNVLDRGLPRLSALCLCRLWDPPRTDRYSLPALLRNASFAKLAHDADPSFIRDCGRFQNGHLISGLRRFRIVDLAHNLPFSGADGGFTVDALRETLRGTQAFVDRLVTILNLPEVRQDAIFRHGLENCRQFWELVAPRVCRAESSK